MIGLRSQILLQEINNTTIHFTIRTKHIKNGQSIIHFLYYVMNQYIYKNITNILRQNDNINTECTHNLYFNEVFSFVLCCKLFFSIT